MSYKARIKFQGKEWLVVDSFKYNEAKYIYIIEDIQETQSSKEIQESEINIKFITQVSGENYVEVDDVKLLAELHEIVALRRLQNIAED